MTIEEIKADLKEIQYYYAHEKEFVGASTLIGTSGVLEKVERYNSLICKASSQLYYLYLSLYIHHNTQLVTALDMQLSVGHIKRLNNKLYKFFQEEWEKGKQICER